MKDELQQWDDALKLKMQGILPPFAPGGAAEAKQKVMARIDAQRGESRVIKLKTQWRGLRAAAIISFVIGLPFLFYFLGLTTIENTGKEQFAMELPDGSTVHLSAESSVQYHRLGYSFSRSVILEGAAFFDIKTGPQFNVRTPFGEVQVLGTSFSVWASSERLTVHCLSGKVRATTKSGPMELNPGELVYCSRKDNVLRKERYDSPTAVLPQTGDTLIFENAPLSLVCAELERAFEIIVISTLSPALRYTGQLHKSDREGSFEILAKTFGASYEEGDGSITLMP